jgi:hypothetical protein
MALPSPAYLRLRDAFGRGDHREVLAEGERLVALLDADPGQRGHLPAAMVMVGAALVQVEHYREAVPWLEQGLVRLPGTPAERDMAGGHWFHRTLADLYLLLGRWDRAAAYLDWLAWPEQPMDSRLAAARGQAALANASGAWDRAHWLLNTAADLARRSRSNLLLALVEGDRAMLLAAQGRLREAVECADTVVPSLAAPAPGPQQAWANAQATAVYSTIARHLAHEGDIMTAERYLLEAAMTPADRRRVYGTAQLNLARATAWREEGDLARAGVPLREAIAAFEALGAAPASAVAAVEDAHLARALGLADSAKARHERALVALHDLGMTCEMALTRQRWSRRSVS